MLTVCDSIVEAVARAATHADESEIASASSTSADCSVLGMWARMDRDAAASAADSSAKLRVVRHGDRARARLETFGIGSALVGARPLGRIVSHLVDNCLRTPGGRGRAGMPRKPTKADSERGAELNELLTFVNVDDAASASPSPSASSAPPIAPSALLHTRTVNLFENLLSSADPDGAAIWQASQAFHRRRFRERLYPSNLSQVLAEAMLEADETLTHYDADTDRLLVATHTRTWHRRRNVTKLDIGRHHRILQRAARIRSLEQRDKRLRKSLSKSKSCKAQGPAPRRRPGRRRGGACQIGAPACRQGNALGRPCRPCAV